MAVLIIGASGYIGNYIYQAIKSQKNESMCLGTRLHSKDNEYLSFDMLKDDISMIDARMPNEENYALICSADGNIESCLVNKEIVYEKNVKATIRLIDRLTDLHYHITFLSTDNVFDGNRGNYTELDDTNPINEYGKMKKEVEQYLIKYVPNSCILRLGKITGDFTHKNDLLVEWYEKALKKETIFCIKGNILTLTHVEDVANCYVLVIQHKLKGIFHIVGEGRDTRYGLCQRFFEHMELEKYCGSSIYLQEIDISQFPFKEKRPLNISMNHSKFVSETGYHFMDINDICKKFKSEYMFII